MKNIITLVNNGLGLDSTIQHLKNKFGTSFGIITIQEFENNLFSNGFYELKDNNLIVDISNFSPDIDYLDRNSIIRKVIELFYKSNNFNILVFIYNVRFSQYKQLIQGYNVENFINTEILRSSHLILDCTHKAIFTSVLKNRYGYTGVFGNLTVNQLLDSYFDNTYPLAIKDDLKVKNLNIEDNTVKNNIKNNKLFNTIVIKNNEFQ